jgi:SAM-dependent methyltransferase
MKDSPVSSAPGVEPPPLAIRAQLRWHVVRPVIETLAPSTTIEIGVGQGAMAARVAALTSLSYVGVELDPVSFGVAVERIQSAGAVVHNGLLSDVAPSPADMLCAFEVLEHIEDDHEALLEWIDYITPGGHLVLSVPADPERFGPMDIHAGHYRRYSQDGIATLARSAGLVDIAVIPYGAPLGYALEAVRNRLDAKKLANAQSAGLRPENLTAASGRTFQFDRRSWKSVGATMATTPFRYLQRVWPGGTGLVVVARRPPSS